MKRMQKKMWIQVNTIMYCFEYTLKVRNHVGVSASLIEPPQLPTAAVNAWNGQIRRNFVIGLRRSTIAGSSNRITGQVSSVELRKYRDAVKLTTSHLHAESLTCQILTCEHGDG